MKILFILLLGCIIFSIEHQGHSHNKLKGKKMTQPRQNVISKKTLRYFQHIPGWDKIFAISQIFARKFTTYSAPLKSAIAVTFISLAPAMFLLIIPVTGDSHKIIQMLVGFAAGCLIGDAFLHLIPHAYEHQKFLKSRDVGLYIILGIFLFYIVEKGTSSFKFHCEKSKRQKDVENILKLGTCKDLKSTCLSSKTSPICQDSTNCAFLGLLADFIHNFMDGTAIASSFLIDTKTGIATTISVFFHEIPHEISDYAILIKSGFKPMKAILLQLVTALGAFAGALLTFYIGSVLGKSGNCIIPALAAGGFIYIACVNLIPDFLAHKGSVDQFLCDSACITFGILTMLLLD